MKIIRLSNKKHGFRLERPAHIVGTFAAAVVLLACVAGGAILLKGGEAPGAANGTGLAAEPQASATPSKITTSQETGLNNKTAEASLPSSSAEATASPMPLPSPLANAASAGKGTLSAQDSILIARAAYLNYFGIDTGNCDVIDEFTKEGSARLLGSDQLIAPGSYDNKAFLDMMILGDGWYFQYYAHGASSTDVQMSINWTKGEAVGGSLTGMGPGRVGYSKSELKKRAGIARQYVIEKNMLDTAQIVKVENLHNDTDVAVALSDGRVITLTLDNNRNVVAFDITTK